MYGAGTAIGELPDKPADLHAFHLPKTGAASHHRVTKETTMTSRRLILPAALCLAGIAASQGDVSKDGFPREGKTADRARKDAL